MKSQLIIFFLTLFSPSLLAQVKTDAYFGLSGRDDGCSNIIEMYDKGYYILGGFEFENNGWNGWNIKADVNFEFIYDKVIENSLSTIASFSSVTDISGNIYITGFMNYPDQWPFIVKIDSCGNNQWCKVLIYEDEFNYGSGIDIILNGNNEVVILATLIDTEQPADQINKVHLIGLNNEGDVLWKKPYASRNDYSWIRNPSVYSIEEINNNYYVSGYCYWPFPDDTTHFFLRPLFIGIDSLFEEKWILPFYALDSVFGIAYKSIPLNDSVFMGVGIRKLPNSFDFGLLMFYNKDGEEIGFNELTNQQIGPDVNSNQFRDIERINDSLFITASLFGPGISTNPGGVLVIDTAANLYNQLSKPNTSSADLIKSYDGNYVFAANIEESKGDDDIYVYKIDENLNDVPFDPTPHTYDSLCPGGIQSGTIDLTSCFVWTDIGEAPSPKEYYSFIATIPITAYPNPAETEITLAFENTEHHSNMLLECYNIYGQKVHSEKIYKGQQQTKLYVGSWGKGLYFAVVKSNGKVAGTVRFVRK